MDRFAENLQEEGLNLSQDSIDQLILAGDETLEEKKLIGTLEITFLYDEPDLLREIPAVPG
ncbi:MAG: hypothetical protein QNJ49_06055 [Mastigocoleus sp. MO_167.B18]|nr:hypothetical protein [Mastigocoleus sp. MO_167.B18]